MNTINIAGNLADAWDRFTESLNSAGGTVALLFVSTALLGYGVIHVMHHFDNNAASEVVISTFSNFTGALLLALTQGAKKSNGTTSSAPAPPASPLPSPQGEKK